ncbi:MAG: HD domain-containing protein [Albidovulum sp.]|nr:HD domain-containing protein [Albidovulum sp.]
MENLWDAASWEILCSRHFQRLRRIKQLGCSELVYPGASHTRFSHSLGVLQTARELMQIVRRQRGNRLKDREIYALAAALLYDVGHGPFSQAFEEVSKRLGLEAVNHELISEKLIREGEIAETLKTIAGVDAADKIADMVTGTGTKTVHNAVVSSQFDADRLDYMRRDRMMTGSRHSSIDFDWLLENLEIDDITTGVDDESTGTVPTFVIGPKAIHAAEAYILGLFQLYPTVYYHKTTRGVEKLFIELLVRLVQLVRDDKHAAVNLPSSHPLIRFGEDPNNMDAVLALDDTVVLGALSQLSESSDKLISNFTRRLLDRNLLKCVDIRSRATHIIDRKNEQSPALIKMIDACCELVLAKLRELNTKLMQPCGVSVILTDKAERSAYKTDENSRGPIERINVKTEGKELLDLRERSKIVASIDEFKLCRAYFDRDKPDIKDMIDNIIEEEAKKCRKQEPD